MNKAILGKDLTKGQRPQVVMPAEVWFAQRIEEGEKGDTSASPESPLLPDGIWTIWISLPQKSFSSCSPNMKTSSKKWDSKDTI